MGDYWFKPKSHGYGASPANWKGWAATAGFIVVTLAILWPWILSPSLASEQPSTAGLAATIAILAVATLGFVWLSKIKTDGAWKWRWGGKE